VRHLYRTTEGSISTGVLILKNKPTTNIIFKIMKAIFKLALMAIFFTSSVVASAQCPKKQCDKKQQCEKKCEKKENCDKKNCATCEKKDECKKQCPEKKADCKKQCQGKKGDCKKQCPKKK
jgi:hypothetical protein